MGGGRGLRPRGSAARRPDVKTPWAILTCRGPGRTRRSRRSRPRGVRWKPVGPRQKLPHEARLRQQNNADIRTPGTRWTSPSPITTSGDRGEVDRRRSTHLADRRSGGRKDPGADAGGAGQAEAVRKNAAVVTTPARGRTSMPTPLHYPVGIAQVVHGTTTTARSCRRPATPRSRRSRSTTRDHSSTGDPTFQYRRAVASDSRGAGTVTPWS
jgi:hypothetical protein